MRKISDIYMNSKWQYFIGIKKGLNFMRIIDVSSYFDVLHI